MPGSGAPAATAPGQACSGLPASAARLQRFERIRARGSIRCLDRLSGLLLEGRVVQLFSEPVLGDGALDTQRREPRRRGGLEQHLGIVVLQDQGGTPMCEAEDHGAAAALYAPKLGARGLLADQLGLPSDAGDEQQRKQTSRRENLAVPGIAQNSKPHEAVAVIAAFRASYPFSLRRRASANTFSTVRSSSS